MYESLYRDNVCLLWLLAKRYAARCNAAVDMEDLRQAGFLGLVRAAETFQEGRGTWINWATYYVRTAMQEALGRHRNSPSMVSLDAPLAEDADFTLMDTIPDTGAPEAEDVAERVDRCRCVREAVDALQNEAIRAAIIGKYFDGKTYAQLAEELGLSGARIGDLVSVGRKQLAKDRRLRAYLDEYTPFTRHKGLAAFNRDWTSSTEAAVLWRERMRERLEPVILPTSEDPGTN